MAAMVGSASSLGTIDGRSLLFIILSGLATGASWRVLLRGPRAGDVSRAAPIDKLSILVTVAFSAAVFHERFTRRYLAGLALMCAGTAAMVVA